MTRLTPAYGNQEAGPGRPAPATAENVAFFVYGHSHGDEQKARAILDALVAEAENGSLRSVAGRHGVNECSLRRWVGQVREGMQRAVVGVSVAMHAG